MVLQREPLFSIPQLVGLRVRGWAWWGRRQLWIL